MTARIARLVAGAAMIALALTMQTAGAQGSTAPTVRLELNGTVDPLVADYLEGSIARAQEEGDGRESTTEYRRFLIVVPSSY